MTTSSPPPLPSWVVRCWAAFHSLWITFIALCAGLLAGAMQSAMVDSPAHLLAYIKAQWFPFAIANLIAPMIRAAQAPPAAATSGTAASSSHAGPPALSFPPPPVFKKGPSP